MGRETEIEMFPEGGGMIIHRVRRTPNCSYCSRPGTQLCDFKLPNGKTCDRPICLFHAYSKPNLDYCQEHKPNG